MINEKLDNKKCIIFDFDGVIADTDAGRFESLSELLYKYAIDLKSITNIRDLTGKSTEKFLCDNFKSLSETDINKIISERKKIFLSNLDKYCIVYPGAVETLRDLHKAGFELILATSNDMQLTKKLLEYHGIIKFFQKIFTREQTENKYTKTKDYRLVLKLLKRNSNECVVIEDSLIGVMAAKNADIFCIAFDRYDDDNVRKKADVLMKDYNDLRNLFRI